LFYALGDSSGRIGGTRLKQTDEVENSNDSPCEQQQQGQDHNARDEPSRPKELEPMVAGHPLLHCLDRLA
jgi:hypothetical protein